MKKKTDRKHRVWTSSPSGNNAAKTTSSKSQTGCLRSKNYTLRLRRSKEKGEREGGKKERKRKEKEREKRKDAPRDIT